MSLSSAAPRRHLHTRTISCEGYHREDGLWDIEARITDTKAYRYTEAIRGVREPGARVHDMAVRLTLDTEMVIKDIEVAMESNPYATCHDAVPAFSGLVGKKIGPGWRGVVQEAVGGVKGCTHVRELLLQMATVAFQTLRGGRADDTPRAQQQSEEGRAFFINGCKAWAKDGEMVARFYPHLSSRKA